jgi:hypothetical protein
MRTDIFLHIAKTGGTTLSFPLRRLYGPWRTHHIGNQDHDGVRPTSYCALSEARKERVRLIKGHVFYGVHEYCPGPARYFTLFRKPVDRVASFHRMLKKEWPSSDVGRMSLRRYIEEDHYPRNGQVRRVAGKPPEEGPCTEATLKTALRHLKADFPVFGLTERFDESLILMKRRLGWEGMPYYVRSRVGRRTNGEEDDGADAGPDPETRERIRAQNALDVRLYDYAAKQFEEMFRDEGADFRTEVEQFRGTNQWVAPLVRVPLQMYRSGRRLLYTLRN